MCSFHNFFLKLKYKVDLLVLHSDKDYIKIYRPKYDRLIKNYALLQMIPPNSI